jgi:DNA-binding XRE family transcriptional regulator
MSRAPHEPTPETRQIVQLHATIGTTQDDIAAVIGIDPKTLRLHYREELDLASAKANAAIGGALFNKAKNGDTTAMIFWMKTRAGWKETHSVEHSGGLKLEGVEMTFVRPKSETPNG